MDQPISSRRRQLAAFIALAGGLAPALRAAAQMVSYEVSIGFVIITVLLFAGSLNLSDIVRAQAGASLFSWNWCSILFPMLPIFFVSALAETNRPPFDLPEAEKNKYLPSKPGSRGYNAFKGRTVGLSHDPTYKRSLQESFAVGRITVGSALPLAIRSSRPALSIGARQPVRAVGLSGVRQAVTAVAAFVMGSPLLFFIFTSRGQQGCAERV